MPAWVLQYMIFLPLIWNKVLPFPCPHKQVQAKLKQHDRALEKSIHWKNKARQALCRAKREGVDGLTIQSLAANFLSLLWQHSWLKRDSSVGSSTRKPRLLERNALHFLEFCKGTSGSMGYLEVYSRVLSYDCTHFLLRNVQVCPPPVSDSFLDATPPFLPPSQIVPWTCLWSLMGSWLKQSRSLN